MFEFIGSKNAHNGKTKYMKKYPSHSVSYAQLPHLASISFSCCQSLSLVAINAKLWGCVCVCLRERFVVTVAKG